MQSSFIIRSSAARFLLCFGSILILVGCQPEAKQEAPPTTAPVTGQVFVVMPAGDNLRLGSVRVQVFDEEAIQSHINQKERQISERRMELSERLSKLEEAASVQMEARAVAEEAYNSRDAEIRRELQELIARVEERGAFLQGQIDSNASFIEFKDTLPPPPQGIPSRGEFEEYDKRRKKWLSMTREERAAWVEVLATLNVDLTAEIEKMAAAREERVFAFADELQALDEDIAAWAKKIASTDEAMTSVSKELDGLPDYSDYLTDLPAPLREVRTDANGEFSLDLRRDRNYVIFAQAERRLGGEKVNLRWFVRADEDRSFRIILSNHNLVTSEASENVINLSAATEEPNT